MQEMYMRTVCFCFGKNRNAFKEVKEKLNNPVHSKTSLDSQGCSYRARGNRKHGQARHVPERPLKSIVKSRGRSFDFIDFCRSG